MSWNTSAGGRARDVVSQVSKNMAAAGQSAGHWNDVMDAIARVSEMVGAKYGADRVVVFETMGHLDDDAGNFTVSFRAFREPKQP